MNEEELKQIEAEEKNKNYIVSSKEQIDKQFPKVEVENIDEAKKQMEDIDKQNDEEPKIKSVRTSNLDEAKKQTKSILEQREAIRKKKESPTNLLKDTVILPYNIGKAGVSVVKDIVENQNKRKDMTPEELKKYDEAVLEANKRKSNAFKNKSAYVYESIFTLGNNQTKYNNILNYVDMKSVDDMKKYLPDDDDFILEYLENVGNINKIEKKYNKYIKNLSPEEQRQKTQELEYYKKMNEWGNLLENGNSDLAIEYMTKYITDGKPYADKARNFLINAFDYDPLGGSANADTSNATANADTSNATANADTSNATANADSNVIGKDVAKEIADAKQEQVDNYLLMAGGNIEDLTKLYDDTVQKTADKFQKIADASDLSKFMPTFAIAHYLQGDFGKKGTGKALGTLGYFLLDKIGVGLTNASLVARGMTPSQKTALESYNKQMMEEAIKRDSNVRTKAKEEEINAYVKNYTKLADAGYDVYITMGNDLASKILDANFKHLDEANLIRLKKEEADWYGKNVSEDDKLLMDRYLSALSTNPDERSRALLDIQKKELELKYIENDAEKAKAQYEIQKATTDALLYETVATTQLKQLSVAVDNAIAQGKLTYNQAEQVYQMARMAKTDADFRKFKNIMDGVNAGTKTLSDLANVAKTFIPGK